MALISIIAHLSCTDMERSVTWYSQVFGRAPDARPMPNLAEWRHGNAAGFQLFLNARHAGTGTLTLIVSGLREMNARLTRLGLKPGAVEPGDFASVVRLHDPDKNLIVLTQPNL